MLKGIFLEWSKYLEAMSNMLQLKQQMQVAPSDIRLGITIDEWNSKFS